MEKIVECFFIGLVLIKRYALFTILSMLLIYFILQLDFNTKEKRICKYLRIVIGMNLKEFINNGG